MKLYQLQQKQGPAAALAAIGQAQQIREYLQAKTYMNTLMAEAIPFAQRSRDTQRQMIKNKRLIRRVDDLLYHHRFETISPTNHKS